MYIQIIIINHKHCIVFHCCVLHRIIPVSLYWRKKFSGISILCLRQLLFFPHSQVTLFVPHIHFSLKWLVKLEELHGFFSLNIETISSRNPLWNHDILVSFLSCEWYHTGSSNQSPAARRWTTCHRRETLSNNYYCLLSGLLAIHLTLCHFSTMQNDISCT